MGNLYSNRLWILAIVLFTAAACSNQEDSSIITEDIPTLKGWDLEYKLPIDEETLLTSSLNYPINEEGNPKILTFNYLTNSLKIYDLKSKTVERTVNFPKEGPNSIQGMGIFSGLKFVNEDTIVFVSPSYKGIYLANLSGQVYKFFDFQDFQYGLGSIALSSPVEYRKGNIYLQALPLSRIDSRQSAPKLIKVNAGNGNVEFLDFNFPDMEEKNYSPKLEMLDIVYHESSDKFLISFPFSDSVYVTNFEEKVNIVIFKSDLVTSMVELDMEDQTVPKEQRISYYEWISDAYGKIYWDPLNDLFIREARSKISSDDFIERKLYPKKEFLIYDSNFLLKSKVEHDGSGVYYHFFDQDKFFINKNIKKFNLNSGIEDTVYFQGIEYNFQH
ncbi:DUF4221 family protein [Algoriphagus namhaensis]